MLGEKALAFGISIGVTGIGSSSAGATERFDPAATSAKHAACVIA